MLSILDQNHKGLMLKIAKVPIRISFKQSKPFLAFLVNCQPTPPNSEIIYGQNVGTKVVCGIILFFEKKAMFKIQKKIVCALAT